MLELTDVQYVMVAGSMPEGIATAVAYVGGYAYTVAGETGVISREWEV